MYVYVCTAIILVAMPWLANSAYAHHIMIMTGLAIILAVSNRLILVSGAWFMGHGAFYGIGAYGVVLLRAKAGLNFWLAFPLIGLVAGIVAVGLGYATSRVKGIPFCLISVAFVEVVRLTIVKIPYLGGYMALECPPPERCLGIDFSSKIHYYYFMLLLVALTLLVFRLIEKSPVGAALKTIADKESLAESVGINTIRYKVMTMAICAFFGGIAGAFYAPYVTVMGPTSFSLVISVFIIFYVVVGGIGNIWGPVTGAIFLTILPEILPSRAAFQNIMYAVFVLASLFFLPDGLISLPRLVWQRLRLGTA